MNILNFTLQKIDIRIAYCPSFGQDDQQTSRPVGIVNKLFKLPNIIFINLHESKT